jgi:integrase/recombinase XerD
LARAKIDSGDGSVFVSKKGSVLMSVEVQATKDLRKVSLWLGHAHLQTTETYTRVDPSVKLEALESIIPPTLRSGRFKATDQLIALLKTRSLMRSEQPRK